MNLYGVEFCNRIKSDTPNGQRERNLAEFAMFAAMCAAFGVAHYVSRVEWNGNIDAFEIETTPIHEHNDIGGAIGFAADCTLSQYVLYDRCYHKWSLMEGL